MSSAYNPDQISQYLAHINLPTTQSYDSYRDRDLNLDDLTTLHVHQISTIPYENLSLHYSKTKQIDLDAQVLFDKFVTRNSGRGGYCLETSIFYHHILKALGFDVYLAGVRIRLRDEGIPRGDFVGWRHVVNIVTLSDAASQSGTTRYMVDVGFGGDGATRPLPLIDGHIQQNLGTQTIRLVYAPLSVHLDNNNDNTATIERALINGTNSPDPAKNYWIYQYRNNDDRAWNSYYAFSEIEWREIDFDAVNFYLCNHADSFQRWMVLAIKFLRNGDDGTRQQMGEDNNNDNNGKPSKVTGKIMLIDKTIKRNLGGKTEVVDTFSTEAERIEGLKKWFGLDLRRDEIEGIKDHWSELKG